MKKPRNVRNFWFNANIDGRENSISTGPKNATGGMGISFFIRDHGEVKGAFDVVALYHPEDSTLRYRIIIPGQDDIIIDSQR